MENINDQTVTIGVHKWSTINLDVSEFNNGELIPHVQENDEWIRAGENKQPAWCYYDNNPLNGNKYGKLYNWFAVTDPRGISPKGYHIPHDLDWTLLKSFLAGEEQAGNKMKAVSGWDNNGNGSNESGFSGLPGGLRGLDGNFDTIGILGLWWSKTESDSDSAWGLDLCGFNDIAHRLNAHKSIGLSVRCYKF